MNRALEWQEGILVSLVLHAPLSLLFHAHVLISVSTHWLSLPFCALVFGKQNLTICIESLNSNSKYQLERMWMIQFGWGIHLQSSGCGQGWLRKECPVGLVGSKSKQEPWGQWPWVIMENRELVMMQIKETTQQAHRTVAYTHTDSLQLSAEFNSKTHLNLKSCTYETHPHMYA